MVAIAAIPPFDRPPLLVLAPVPLVVALPSFVCPRSPLTDPPLEVMPGSPAPVVGDPVTAAATPALLPPDAEPELESPALVPLLEDPDDCDPPT